jgi:hypothetical protein
MMRAPQSARLLVLLGLVFWVLPLHAGGPMIVGGPGFGKEGKPFTWNPAAMPIHYRVDGGPMARTPSGGTVISNSAGITRVQNMFQVWQNVATAQISFVKDGAINRTGAFADGDVSTATELDAVMDSCDRGEQTPIIFDADGGLMADLGYDSGVIGFAGPCKLDEANGYIVSGIAVMNGQWQDGISSSTNGELTAAEFDEAFVHEFGHLIGLDHSQINASVLDGYYPCSSDNLAGLPVMFPYLSCQARTSEGLPPLAPDDIAWISKLYPAPNFATQYGAISGYILFSDGISHAQGVNVIARRVDDTGTPANESLRVAFSVVSGYLFTGNPGQSVTGTNDGGDQTGSRDPLLIGYYEIRVLPGNYTVEVESIRREFDAGSSVGPLIPPIWGGQPEFWNHGESATDSRTAKDPITVTAGQKVEDINIILNGTAPRFDQFEGSMAALGRGGSWPSVGQYALRTDWLHAPVLRVLAWRAGATWAR